jgi:hypothetical protein
LYIDSVGLLLIYSVYVNSVVTVEDDKSKKSDIVEEMPVEQSADVADLENAVTTVISADGENEDNAGEFLMFLLVYCIIVQ